MQQCKFLLLRYVPDAAKNEFVNIGLIFLPPNGPAELRFDKNWSRLRSSYPYADTELLDGLRNDLSSETDRELILTKMEDSFSTTLQISEYKACLARSPIEEADKLAKIYLQAPRKPRARETSARETILRVMQREFEREQVWKSMEKQIDISRYTHAGDPLRIDRGYGAKDLFKMFHATPLRWDVDAAKILAFSYPQVAAGIRKHRNVNSSLTAIVEDGLDKNEEVEFALATLGNYGIEVATVADLPSLALTAARDLGIR